MAVLSQHSPPRTSGSGGGGGGGEGVNSTDDDATLEMQRYIAVPFLGFGLWTLLFILIGITLPRRVLAKLRSFNSSVEQDLNEQRTKLERCFLLTLTISLLILNGL